MNNNYTGYNYTKKYYHLDKNKRLIIEQMFQKNKSLRQIAKILGVNVSTVSREVKRNSHHEYGYLAN
ncbi:helix-turn-helix domain-containing protein, partial [[Mycoplasma] collis]|uniref:helix-turn-helix domain-containing protein n=1 Tax=[Mycoplasma] collis TaxID=2127 RepID=UPI00051B7B94